MPPRPLVVSVPREEILEALLWACRREGHSVDRKGLKSRNLAERIDNMAMGDIAEKAVRIAISHDRWKSISYNEIRQDDFQEQDPGWDLACSSVESPSVGWVDSDPKEPNADWERISVKSSRIPEANGESIDLVISRRDFKILKYSDTIEEDLAADVEVQAYFPYTTTQLPELDTAQVEELEQAFGKLIEEPSIDSEALGAICDLLEIEERFQDCTLIGYLRTKEIITINKGLRRRTWKFWGKEYWCAPLSRGRTFEAGDMNA